MKRQKKSVGFTLIGLVISIAIVGIALGMVGMARQKRETVRKQLQKSIEQAEQEGVKVEEETNTKEDTVSQKPQKYEEPSTSRKSLPPEIGKKADEIDKKKAEGPGSFDVSQCFPGSPDPVCTAIFGQEPRSWYEQQQQETQQQLYEQYYYYQQQQQQQMFDPNQFMQNPYQQFNPVFQNLYHQMFPGVFPQIFP